MTSRLNTILSTFKFDSYELKYYAEVQIIKIKNYISSTAFLFHL